MQLFYGLRLLLFLSRGTCLTSVLFLRTEYVGSMTVPEPTSEDAAALWLFVLAADSITTCILQIKTSGSEWMAK